MASPTTRAQFKDYCLRRLGWPVISINVDDDQVEDRIDDASRTRRDSRIWDEHWDQSVDGFAADPNPGDQWRCYSWFHGCHGLERAAFMAGVEAFAHPFFGSREFIPQEVSF